MRAISQGMPVDDRIQDLETSRVDPLTPERIVDEALIMLDVTGLDGLSTRKLAARLGIKSASLYWHFENKDALLNSMCARMFDQALPAPEPETAGFDWANWLADGARGIRAVALAKRDGARIMARNRSGRITSMKLVRRNITVLMDAGMSEKQAIFSLTTLRRFAVGSALHEQANLDADVSSPAAVGDEVFEFGLDTIVGSLRRMTAPSA